VQNNEKTFLVVILGSIFFYQAEEKVVVPTRRWLSASSQQEVSLNLVTRLDASSISAIADYNSYHLTRPIPPKLIAERGEQKRESRVWIQRGRENNL